MADQNPTNRERVKEIVDGIEQNIQELFQSERYFDYLRTMSRFHTYSVNNTILIHMQRPNAATPVAGFQKWKQFGRHVKKGEKGLTIIAPTPLKKRIEEMKLDPDTREPVYDLDGNPVMEEKTIEIPLFKPVKVFSADQTEGKPLPSLVADLTGNVQQYEAFMEALRRTSPVPIEIKPIDKNMDGYFSNATQSIAVREGMSEVQTVCATVHEIAHAVLHNRERDRLTSDAGITDKEPPKPKDENTMEVEAESVSFAVCQYYGIDTSANSLGYIATWSKNKSLPELKASLETITKTSSGLISAIDKHFAEICKERGIDLTAQPEVGDSPEKFVSDLSGYLCKLQDSGIVPMPSIQELREPAGIEEFLMSVMREGRFSSFRGILDDIEQRTNMPTTAALRDRMEKLSDQWDAALVCKIEPIFGVDSTADRSAVQTYQKQGDQLTPVKPVFVGTMAECQSIIAGLEAGTLTLRQVRQPGFEPPAVPERPEYEYKMEVNAGAGGRGDTHFIQAYEKTENAKLLPERVLFVGSADMCQRLLDGLKDGSIQRDDFVLVSAARISCYTTKDGAELDALVTMDDKVYLGRRDHYDNRGHYLNNDHSLIHISDNEKVFDVISGDSIPYTHAELLGTGYFTQEEFDRFIALRLNEPQPEREAEALFLVDNAVYLHVQTCDEGWDYTLYEKDSQVQMDGGLLDAPALSSTDAALRICRMQEIGAESIQPVSVELLETLQAAQPILPEAETPRDYTGELREHFAQEDTALWDTTLDEYPMPDTSLTLDDLAGLGYSDSDLLPLSRERAAELLEQDMTVYTVQAGENPEMVFDQDDLMEQPEGVMFAVPREEWEASPDFRQAVADRMDHQEAREQAFLGHNGDCFAIYQVKDDPALRDIRFESLEWVKSRGQTVERGNYDLAYTAPLPAADSVDAALDRLWQQFNTQHPADYQRPSMSVSDIVAIRRDGVLSCHYCDRFGFQQLPDFIKPENYLKNAEMAAEDDYNMIDGIINNGPKATVAELEQQARSGQPISLMDLADAVHRERGEKKSVLAKLNAKPPQRERKKSAPKKSAEKER